jgi:hypothetical protein
MHYGVLALVEILSFPLFASAVHISTRSLQSPGFFISASFYCMAGTAWLHGRAVFTSLCKASWGIQVFPVGETGCAGRGATWLRD